MRFASRVAKSAELQKAKATEQQAASDRRRQHMTEAKTSITGDVRKLMKGDKRYGLFFFFTMLGIAAILIVTSLHFGPLAMEPPRNAVIPYKVMFWTNISIAASIWLVYTASDFGKIRFKIGAGLLTVGALGGGIAWLVYGVQTTDWNLMVLATKLGLREAVEPWQCVVDTQRFSVPLGKCIPAIGNLADLPLGDGWRLTYADDYVHVLSKNFAGKNVMLDLKALVFKGLSHIVVKDPSSSADRDAPVQQSEDALFDAPVSWNMITVSSHGQPRLHLGEREYDFELDEAKKSPNVWVNYALRSGDAPVPAEQLLQYRWSTMGTSGKGLGEYAQWRVYNALPDEVFKISNGAVELVEVRMPMDAAPEKKQSCANKQVLACEVDGFQKSGGCPCMIDEMTVSGVVTAETIRRQGVQYACGANKTLKKTMCKTLIDGTSEAFVEMTRDCPGKVACQPLFVKAAKEQQLPKK